MGKTSRLALAPQKPPVGRFAFWASIYRFNMRSHSQQPAAIPKPVDSVTPGPSQVEESVRVPQLDGLRGLAVIAVVVYHYFNSAAFHWLMRLPASFGWCGVDLFFVMSGFLIGGIVLDRRSAPNFLRVFYARRAFRIIPLYYCLLAGGAIGALLGFRLGAAKYFVIQLAFLQNIALAFTQKTSNLGPDWLGPTWSLAVEEHFYLLLPLLITCVKPARLRAILIGLAASSFLLRVLTFVWRPAHVWVISLFWTPCRIEELLYGVLVAIAARNASTSGAEWRPRATSLWAGAALSGGVLVVATFLDRRNDSYALTNTIGISGAGLCSVMLLMLAVGPTGGIFARWIAFPPLRWVGLRAYGIYLLHMPVQLAVDSLRSSPPDVQGRAVALILTGAVASLSWTFLEAPMIEVGHRLRYQV